MSSLMGYPLNLKTVKDALSPLGITVSWSVDTKEFRVNFRKGKESTAYYTSDLLDAFKTGHAMAESFTPKPEEIET